MKKLLIPLLLLCIFGGGVYYGGERFPSVVEVEVEKVVEVIKIIRLKRKYSPNKTKREVKKIAEACGYCDAQNYVATPIKTSPVDMGDNEDYIAEEWGLFCDVQDAWLITIAINPRTGFTVPLEVKWDGDL